MPIFNNILAGAAGQGGAAAPANITKSLRFSSGDSAYLSRTPSSDGNRRTFTFSCWVKRSKLVDCGSSGQEILRVGNSNPTSAINFAPSDGPCDALSFKADQGGVAAGSATNAQFRDFSAWMHVVYRIDTTQATAADRVRVYVNGVEQTWHTTNYPSQNQELKINQSGQPHYIGGLEYFDGYLADIYMIDGSSLEPTSFGAYDSNGVWQATEYSGTFGTNGFHLLDFANESTVGHDSSGNNNDFTANNISVADGTTPLASATGALPIHNTTDTHGTTKGSGTRTDSNSSTIVLAIPMDGANNGTTFADESATIKGSGSAQSITRNGDTKTSTTQSQFYGSSGYFDGTGDYLLAASSADFAFGTGNFTVEFWYYHIHGGDRGLFANNSGSSVGVNFLVGAGGPFRIYNGTSANNLTDFSASPTANTWQHLAVVRNGGTVTLYVDGQASGTASWSGVNAGDTSTFSVGAAYGNARFAYGYIQDFRVYKGTAKYTSNFTPPNATADPTTAAGNDALFDVPTNYDDGTNIGGNYCTWNPLTMSRGNMSQGNLLFYGDGTNTPRVNGTISQSSGKWYYEATVLNDGPGTGSGDVHNSIGWGLDTVTQIESAPNNSSMTHSFYFMDSGWYKNFSGSNTNTGNGKWLTGDVIGVAADLDNNTITFYRNGTSVLSQTIGVTAGTRLCPAHQSNTGSYGRSVTNFGQRPFQYPPGGTGGPAATFKSLCTQNLDDPTIADGSAHFDTKLYNGNGGTNAITGYEFSPDFVWLKRRSGSKDHSLFDSVRGIYLQLFTNNTDGEASKDTSLTSFDSNGFTLGLSNRQNENGYTNVAWAWDAGSSNTTISAGGLNSSLYDQSATWSGSLTASNSFMSGYGATYGFNGVTSGNHAGTNSGGTITFAPNLTIPANSTIEVYAGSAASAAMDITVNGVSNNSTPGGSFVQVNYNNSTTLTSLTITRTGGGNSADLRGIKINGKLLVDYGVTLANVPSIASTVRANPTAGFSIVEWTPTQANGTIGHGLNAAPEFVITKSKTSGSQWFCFHSALGGTKAIALESTGAAVTTSSRWNDTAPTNSVVHLGDGGTNYYTSDSAIAYCFAPVAGYSAIGSYTGNGSSDGPFIYTGFRPAFLLVKRTDGTAFWCIMDSARDPENVMSQQLYPNAGNAEGSGDVVDFLSNGFKIRSTSNEFNTAAPYIYYAVAENPFKTARAR